MTTRTQRQDASAGLTTPDWSSRPSAPTSRGRLHTRKAAYDNRSALPSSDPSPAAVWLSGKDAAEYVGVSWPTLRQFILDHGVPYVRLGTRWKIERAVLDASLRRTAEIAAGD
jgi:excisionase family DNA binding protein